MLAFGDFNHMWRMNCDGGNNIDVKIHFSKRPFMWVNL